MHIETVDYQADDAAISLQRNSGIISLIINGFNMHDMS